MFIRVHDQMETFQMAVLPTSLLIAAKAGWKDIIKMIIPIIHFVVFYKMNRLYNVVQILQNPIWIARFEWRDEMQTFQKIISELNDSPELRV